MDEWFETTTDEGEREAAGETPEYCRACDQEPVAERGADRCEDCATIRACARCGGAFVDETDMDVDECEEDFMYVRIPGRAYCYPCAGKVMCSDCGIRPYYKYAHYTRCKRCAQ